MEIKKKVYNKSKSLKQHKVNLEQHKTAQNAVTYEWFELKLFENEYFANFSFWIFHVINPCKNDKSYKIYKT